jgi:hypothetical protein
VEELVEIENGHEHSEEQEVGLRNGVEGLSLENGHQESYYNEEDLLGAPDAGESIRTRHLYSNSLTLLRDSFASTSGPDRDPSSNITGLWLRATTG